MAVSTVWTRTLFTLVFRKAENILCTRPMYYTIQWAAENGDQKAKKHTKEQYTLIRFAMVGYSVDKNISFTQIWFINHFMLVYLISINASAQRIQSYCFVSFLGIVVIFLFQYFYILWFASCHFYILPLEIPASTAHILHTNFLRNIEVSHLFPCKSNNNAIKQQQVQQNIPIMHSYM